MKIIIQSLAIIFCAFLVIACSHQAPSPDSPGPLDGTDSQASLAVFQGPKANRAERKACIAAGGAVSPQGLAGYEMCVLPYKDAGKTCSDSSECLGQCRAQSLSTPQQSEATQAVKGQCQANNIPFGCYSEIIDGTVQPGLCVD